MLEVWGAEIIHLKLCVCVSVIYTVKHSVPYFHDRRAECTKIEMHQRKIKHVNNFVKLIGQRNIFQNVSAETNGNSDCIPKRTDDVKNVWKDLQFIYCICSALMVVFLTHSRKVFIFVGFVQTFDVCHTKC